MDSKKQKKASSPCSSLLFSFLIELTTPCGGFVRGTQRTVLVKGNVLYTAGHKLELIDGWRYGDDGAGGLMVTMGKMWVVTQSTGGDDCSCILNALSFDSSAIASAPPYHYLESQTRAKVAVRTVALE